ncbi:MAG: heme-dependent peroxidase [Gemmatimonadetes bacterium]|nr:heme-dependent peroxidase [Gemmatimonadota bacterium]
MSRTPPATLEGWYVLHQSFRIDWADLKRLDVEARRGLRSSLEELLVGWSRPGEDGWSAAYRLAGGGLDLLLLHFRSDVEGLIEAGHRIQLSEIGDYLLLEDEYLSVVEMGLYALTAKLAERIDPADHEAWRAALATALEEEREKDWIKRRLYPVQPDAMPYVCFYPMDKRRAVDRNWYTLPLDRRAALMSAHGSIGRQYAGRISQVISGSMGLDDREWAVTLWARDPLEFKNIISEMRYDGASAEYADFGAFLVGKRLEPTEVSRLIPAEDE